MKNLIINEFRINKRNLIVSYTIFLTLFILYFFNDYFTNNFTEDDNTLAFINYLSIIYAIFLVIIMFSYNKKRASCDLYYSLPLSKKDLFLSKYLYCIINITIISISMYLISFIAKYLIYDYVNLYIYLLIVLVGIGVNIATFNCFLVGYYLANNYLDAFLYVSIFLFLPLLISVWFTNGEVDGPYMTIFSIDKIAKVFSNYITHDYQVGLIHIIKTNPGMKESILYNALWFISIIGLYFYTKKEDTTRCENIGKIHKILLPISYLSLIFGIYQMGSSIGIIFYMVVYFFIYILYAIFNRTLKIPKDEIIVLIVLLFFTLTAI